MTLNDFIRIAEGMKESAFIEKYPYEIASFTNPQLERMRMQTNIEADFARERELH